MFSLFQTIHHTMENTLVVDIWKRSWEKKTKMRLCFLVSLYFIVSFMVFYARSGKDLNFLDHLIWADWVSDHSHGLEIWKYHWEILHQWLENMWKLEIWKYYWEILHQWLENMWKLDHLVTNPSKRIDLCKIRHNSRRASCNLSNPYKNSSNTFHTPWRDNSPPKAWVRDA